MPFLTKNIDVRQLDEKNWQILSDIVWEGNTETITVPAGLTTDFASVPQIMTAIIPKYGKHLPAALVHDYLWSLSREGKFKKSDADGIFRKIMRELGVGPLKRWMMWAAVRIAGGPLTWNHAHMVIVFLLGIVGAVYMALPALITLAFLTIASLLNKTTSFLERLLNRIHPT